MTYIRSASYLLRWLVFLATLFNCAPLLAQTPPPDSGTPAANATPTLEPSPLPATAAVPDGTTGMPSQVDAWMAQMSSADRVGQLFIITFEGDNTSFEGDIVELIHGYRIGGVMISPRNGNFSNERGMDTPQQVATLTNQLQAIAYGVLLPPENALDPVPLEPWPPRDFRFLPDLTGAPPTDIPLLIAVEQAGDDQPATALRRGFTPLPSQMALGATWDPALVTQTGAVVGRELAAVGVNVVIGPTLDVLDKLDLKRTGSLGTYAFGGDPYWVSRLGSAYITGVHEGGAGRVATVARHFPGQGNADRLPDEEVATIQMSLDELRRIALPPFVAVTRQPSSVLIAGGDPGATDILMTSHMRYSGFQGGGGRATPLSLAPELRTLLAQEGFDAWHDAGGVIMSNALGVPAIRRHYSASASDFFNRRVALDAFLAGNDLLYLADFSLDDRWDTAKANIKETIGFFQDRYNNDPDFAGRVDASVRRILQLKLGLYRNALGDTAPAGAEPVAAPDSGQPAIPLSNVLATSTGLDVLKDESAAQAEALMGQVARAGMTILYPDPAVQTEPLPPAFQPDDRILIFSDSRLMRECSTCTAETAIGPDELANIIVGLYGSDATGQIDPVLITSLTFAELTAFLDLQATAPLTTTLAVTATDGIDAGTVVTGALPAASTPITATPAVASLMLPTPTPAPPDLEALLPGGTEAPLQERTTKIATQIQEAHWIIFAMLNVGPAVHPASDAVQRFLREYSDRLTDQKLVVLSLNAPYFLDATEMSRLTTYFGVYSKTQPFLEGAVRALFRAFTVAGAPPVAVPGTRFGTLRERLSPDPARTIALVVGDGGGGPIAANEAVPGAPAAEEQPALPIGATLRITAGPIYDRNGHPVPDGAIVDFQLQFDGEVLALAVAPALTRSGMAVRDLVVERSGTLRIAATADQATTGQPVEVVILPPPTTVAPAATDGPLAAGATEGVDTPPAADPNAAPNRVNLLTLLIALSTIVLTLSFFLIVQVRVLPRATLVHNMLWAAIFGLIGYILYGLGLFPGADWLRRNVSVWGAAAVVFVPMLLPLLWLQLRGEDR